jgi:hypothetical protein
MSKTEYYTLPEVARALGRKYDEVKYAATYKRIVAPRQIGRTRLFRPAQVEALRAYFANKPAKRQPTEATTA